MSENASVAAPAATTDSAPAVVEAPAVPTGKNPGEVARAGRANAAKLGEKYAAAREQHHAATQPRAEDGKFVPVAEAAPAADATTQVLDGSAPAEATASPVAAEGPPEGMVRIELPEGHPLRDQGETHLDVPAAQERKWRTAVNAAARRADVEAAEVRVQEERAARLRLEAELRFVREQGGQFWTAEHQATYDDLLRAYGQDAADAYKRGQAQKAEGAMAQVRESADLEAVTQHWNTEGGQFRDEALRVLPEKIPGLQRYEVEQAIKIYALEVEAAQDKAWRENQHRMSRVDFERQWMRQFRFTEEDFYAVAGDYLKTRPGVIAASGQTKAAQELRERQIRAEAEAAERERLKQAGQRHATNPHKALGGVPTGTRTTDTTPQPPDRSKMSASDIRRSARDAARAAGEAIDQQRRL